MISAQNPLQRLSGNKFFFLGLLLTGLTACSPKIQQVKSPAEVEKVKEEKEEKKPDKKFTEATVSLLIPFKLNQINLKTAQKADLEKAAMGINFYQGVKLGIDSASSMGLNFKINVFDSRDSNAQLEKILLKDSLNKSNLIIGPVYPEGLKYLKNYSIKHNLLIVSPLAATQPAEFGNPNLVSVVNNIDLHAVKIGDYISSKYLPSNTVVVLINPKKSDDEIFGAPLRNYFQQGKGSKFEFQEYGSVFSLELQLQKNKKYVLLISSSEKPFVTATMDKLLKMKKAGMSFDLFGHPNWVRQNYSTDKLQALNTYVTSSYKVDYRSPAVISFVRKYRALYGFEPDEYSFKGFDTGFYFGVLLANYGVDFANHLTQEKYKGLQNTYTFIYDQKNGYINTSLMLFKYSNYALTLVK
jgi:ABC-type branched-subunit amino acid transport system substrate-binding protein